MFEHWSERRRRWFLIVFSATAWLLFSNELAFGGPTFEDGGIGPDAAHAVSLIGITAAWTLLAAAFKLHLRHYFFAILFGIGLSALLIQIGFDRHTAAGIWSVACDDGDGTACHNLAEYYDAGASPIGGSLDSGPLHRRACALGGPETAGSCRIARSLGLRRHERTEPHRGARDCERGVRSACLRLARELEAQGRLEEAYERYSAACRLSGQDDGVEACSALLDSGYPGLRLQACDAIEAICATSFGRSCVMSRHRCDRARSPFAGVSP